MVRHRITALSGGRISVGINQGEWCPAFQHSYPNAKGFIGKEKTILLVMTISEKKRLPVGKTFVKVAKPSITTTQPIVVPSRKLPSSFTSQPSSALVPSQPTSYSSTGLLIKDAALVERVRAFKPLPSASRALSWQGNSCWIDHFLMILFTGFFTEFKNRVLLADKVNAIGTYGVKCATGETPEEMAGKILTELASMYATLSDTSSANLPRCGIVFRTLFTNCARQTSPGGVTYPLAEAANAMGSSSDLVAWFLSVFNLGSVHMKTLRDVRYDETTASACRKGSEVLAVVPMWTVVIGEPPILSAPDTVSVMDYFPKYGGGSDEHVTVATRIQGPIFVIQVHGNEAAKRKVVAPEQFFAFETELQLRGIICYDDGSHYTGFFLLRDTWYFYNDVTPIPRKYCDRGALWSTDPDDVHEAHDWLTTKANMFLYKCFSLKDMC